MKKTLIALALATALTQTSCATVAMAAVPTMIQKTTQSHAQNKNQVANAEKSKTDIVISNADADKLRDPNTNLSFLADGKVVILVD